jgi:DNA repair protein RecO
MPERSRVTEALVIKRKSTGEADSVVTLLSPDLGKVAVIAKGVRKLASSRRGILESGNIIKCQLITTQSMPLLTQATLTSDCYPIIHSLPKLRQLTQVLEIVDKLFVEEQMDDDIFREIITIRNEIVDEGPTSGRVIKRLENVIEALGFQSPADAGYANLSEYVSHLSDKPLRTWEYLKVK